MNSSVYHMVCIQSLCCRQPQPGAVGADDVALCLAWRPGAAGKTGVLSSAVSPSLWIWKTAVSGGTPGTGDPFSRMMGRGWGGMSTLTVNLAERCLTS